MHDHKQTYKPMPLHDRVSFDHASSDSIDAPDLARRQTIFDEHCHLCQRIDSLSVRLRVPMVLFFVGNQDHEADALMRELDLSRPEFDAKQIQLLIVVKDLPSNLAIRLNITVPIIGDNGLGALLKAQPNCQNSNAAVIMGNDGLALDIVRKFPFMHPALPILGGIDRLSAQFPRLFSTAQ